MTSSGSTYPPPIPDVLPEPHSIPQRRLLVCDYHLQGPPGAIPRVPSAASDAFSGHLHGWLYHLQGIDPSERRPCDPEQEMAPFGAWLLGDGHPARRPGQISVRVCWYGEELAHRATAVMARNPAAIIGAQPFVVAGIIPCSRQPVAPQPLLDEAEDARTLRISTISPLALVRNTRCHVGLGGTDLLPTIVQRWQRIWPGTLPEAGEDGWGWMRRIATARLDLRSEMYHAGKVHTMAVRGSAEWDLQSLKPSQRKVTLALLRGAAIFGAGSRCAYGLGAVRVEVVR